MNGLRGIVALAVGKIPVSFLVLLFEIAAICAFVPQAIGEGVDEFSWIEATPEAPWPSRSGHSTVVFDGKIWILGGWHNGPFLGDDYELNDVWSSTDGVNWTQVTEHAAWVPRQNHKSVVFDGKIWVIGGWQWTGPYLNDVWLTEDGMTWTRVTDHAAWSIRCDHGVAVFNDRLWVVGGGVDGNDVWYSLDGANWTRATRHAAWSPRLWHAVTVHDGALWVLGGSTSTMS